MMEVITAIAVACVPLLATWITTQAIPWLKARTTAEQRKTLMMLVRSAVRAAEQVFKGQQGETVSTEKLAYAKIHVIADLQAAGEKVPEEAQLVGCIEAAVLELTVRQEWALENGPASCE